MTANPEHHPNMNPAPDQTPAAGRATTDAATPLQRFVQLRRHLGAQRIGDGGREVCSRLTTTLDAAVTALANDLGPGVAVVAMGGYGRGEQCLWSDIDLMLLHEQQDTEELARAVLYPLWDAHLKVGHAVRTVAECRQAAEEDFETLTSLLSARLVVGDRALFDRLMDEVTELLRRRPLGPVLAGRERDRRRREPWPLMSADLKEGRGGLRTHQGFWWERRRAELLGFAVDTPSAAEVQAHDVLLTVRNALHAVTGRATDRFITDIREKVGAWSGTDAYGISAALMSALERGDRLAERRWPDLLVEHDPLVGFGRRLFAQVRSRFSPVAEEEAADGVLTLAVRAAGRPQGPFFTPREEEAIRASTAARWTAADRKAFVTLLSAGLRGRTIFGRLEDLGWVEREIPEWSAVATAPQLAPFHDHPVGAHLWRTATEMRSLVEGAGKPGWVSAELDSTEELFLAAFFHDIGKARGGDHAVVGSELAERFLRRHGFGAATVAIVVDAVRHHLLLSETATRRDLADPRVIDEVAALVGDLRRLRVLYLLTIADLRATGTTMWNSWRATLLERLYDKVRHALEMGVSPPATPDVDTVVAVAGSDVDRRTVEEHVAAMSDDYLATTTPDEVLSHLDAARRLTGPSAVHPDPTDPTRVLLVGKDRAGFLLAVTRAFTAHRIAILDARLRTRADGIAFDTFHVANDRTGQPPPRDRWAEVAADLAAALDGHLDLRPAIRSRVDAYRPGRPPDRVEVRVRREGRYTMVEVRASDRVGLLADIVEALHGEGLDIHLARIDTMGGIARDVFYTRRVGGIPIVVEAELAALRRRLTDQLRPG